MVEQATEWQIPIFVMDCDVAAAFDHVSHHLIIDAMEALEVPLVLVSAWVREYRRSETYIKLYDIMTPVPQGDPCAADLFGAVKGASLKSGGCPMGKTTWGSCCSMTLAGS